MVFYMRVMLVNLARLSQLFLGRVLLGECCAEKDLYRCFDDPERPIVLSPTYVQVNQVAVSGWLTDGGRVARRGRGALIYST